MAAVAIHTLFNQFPDQPLLAMLGTIILSPIAIMVTFKMGSGEAQQWLKQESSAHRQMLKTLRSGAFPDDVHGRRIAALAARAGTGASDSIREYWEVLTSLVLTAEETLLEQSTADERTVADARAAFDRLAVLKRALGPSLMTALKPLLPFSRNDYWEVSELEERLKSS
jgi:hypothetical protein